MLNGRRAANATEKSSSSLEHLVPFDGRRVRLAGPRSQGSTGVFLAAEVPAPPPLAAGAAVPAGPIAAPGLDRRPPFDVRPIDDHNYEWYNQ
jgi:hypothetical protein